MKSLALLFLPLLVGATATGHLGHSTAPRADEDPSLGYRYKPVCRDSAVVGVCEAVPTQSWVATVAITSLDMKSYCNAGDDTKANPDVHPTYSRSGAPSGININSSTGVVTGTPAAGGTGYMTVNCTNDLGTYVVTVAYSVSPPGVTGVVAAGYFVDCEVGSDSNLGTNPSSPWRHLSKLTGLPVGTDAWLKADKECVNQTLNINWSGTTGDHVVVGSYYTSSGVAYQLVPSSTLTLSPRTYTWSDTQAVIKGTYNSACSRTLSGNVLASTTCKVDTAGAFPPTRFAPLVTLNCSYCEVQSIHITEGAGRGLELGRVGSGQSVAAGYHDRWVRYMWVDQHATGSIQVFPGTNDWLFGNIFEKCCASQDKADAITTGHASQIQVGTYDVGQNGVWLNMGMLIENNDIGPGWGEGIIVSKSGKVNVRGNRVGSTTDVPIYMAECANCVIEYNVVWGGHLPGRGGAADSLPAENGFYGYMEPAFVQSNSNLNDLVIRGNLFANTANCIKLSQAPMLVSGVQKAFTSAKVYSNTCINMSTGANVRNDIAGRIGPNGIHFRNNIFYNEAGGTLCEATTPAAAGLDWDYNYWGSTPTASCRGTHDPTAGNPLFTGSGFNTKTSNTTPPVIADFVLQSGSPALATGVALSSTILSTADFPTYTRITTAQQVACTNFDLTGFGRDAVCRVADSPPDAGALGR